MGRRRVAMFIGMVIFLTGVATVVFVQCATVQLQLRGSMTMGYSTGKELFEGNCKNKATLLECSDCCLTLGAGLPAMERQACVDLCIDKFTTGGGSMLVAYEAVIEAAKTVRARDMRDIIKFNNAKRFLRSCTLSRHPRVKDMAIGLCDELVLTETAES